MTTREERGLIIAAMCKLVWEDGYCLVPSQTTPGKHYKVDPERKKCNCLDCQEGGNKCKHQFAEEFSRRRELGGDGSVLESKEIVFSAKKTYKQDWPSYNLAQTTEKHRFQQLLHDLCRGVAQPPRQPGKPGRNPLPLSDAIFAATFKVYSTFSARRFACDLRDAHGRGHLTRPIHHNAISAYLENPQLTPMLHALIARSALPLRTIDKDFAVDSSGFSSSKFVRWQDAKSGVTRSKHAWIKIHLICGVKSNIVTSVRILDKDAADSPQFAPLVNATSQDFEISDVAADRAYLSHANLELVDALGGTAFIHPKSNTLAGDGVWGRMFHYYQFRQQEFLDHYHKRSNVESTFSMIKRKFGDAVRSRTDVAMVNEVLAKVLAHNICVVIASQCELKIAPMFWPEGSERPAVLPMNR